MLSSSVAISLRFAFALGAAAASWGLIRYVSKHPHAPRHDTVLVGAYAASRLGLWLIFALFLQRHVTDSDPRLFYVPMLDHFLAGQIPIRDFFYPYGPLLVPAMIPFYLVFGRGLAGISLFAITAELIALVFFVKAARKTMDPQWARAAGALYLLNPATLYWTVLHGYNGIVQTAYSMAGLYCLIRGRSALGYAAGLLGAAGARLVAALDWPALLAVRRPAAGALLLGALPLVAVYAVFQLVSGNILFPVTWHADLASEGTLWFLLVMFLPPGSFRDYLIAPNALPMILFAALFVPGFAAWARAVRSGRAAFSFPAALGLSTYAVALFLICSRYAASYYIPILMLPASVVVMQPGGRWPWSRAALLFVSALAVPSDAIWMAIGRSQTVDPGPWFFGPAPQQAVVLLWKGALFLKLAACGALAWLGLRLALGEPGAAC